jgi:hypothetical protein
MESERFVIWDAFSGQPIAVIFDSPNEEFRPSKWLVMK